MHFRIPHIWIHLFLLCLPYFLKAQADTRFRHFGKLEGLSQNSVFGIAQDGRGVMWFGTREGLNEYDGYRFKIHRHEKGNPASIPSDDIRTLAYDEHRNCLWIGTTNGLARHDFSTGKWERFGEKGANPDLQSFDIVRHIMVDEKDHVWVSTSNSLNLLRTGSESFIRLDLPTSFGRDIKVAFEDEQRIWVGTEKGLYLYPEKENWESRPLVASEVFPELSPLEGFHLKTINQRKKGEFWFGTQSNGIWRWEKEASELTPFQFQEDNPNSLSHNNIRTADVTKDGTLWVGTFVGLNLYLPEGENFRRFQSDDFNSNGLRNSSIRSVFMDNQENLWVGTYYGGVHYLNEEFSRFEIFRHRPGVNSLSFDVVSSFAETPSGDLWIGTEGGGLNYYDKNTGLFSFLKESDGLKGSNVKALCLDESSLFVGMFQNGLYQLDTESRRVRHFPHDPAEPNSISHDNVYALLKDGDTLWIGTYGGGLNRMEIKDGTFTRFASLHTNAGSLASNWVRCLLKSPDGGLWVGTDDGLNEALGYENGQLNFRQHLEDIKVYSMIYHQGKIWVGSFGQGLISFDPKSGKSRLFTQEDGLPGNSILGILPDEKGNLWLSTNNGISRFNLEREVFTNYSHSDGLENLEFNYNAFYQSQSGHFLFGGTSGFTRFHPDDLQPSTIAPPIIFTGLRAFNREIEAGGADGLLEKPLDETEEITFQYGDANFTIHFAAMDFANPSGNRFAYRMVGLNEDWTNVSGRPEATYTLQQEGQYTFELKAANKDGVWNPETRFLRVRVLPPPSRTWWAYLIYLSLLGLMIAAAVRIVKLRQSNKMGKLEKEQQAAMHQMKMRFFTNVAHEFRTPLTLIIGPLDDLVKGGSFEGNSSTKKRLNTIHSNAQRMLDLVNQLLTFRKMEEGHEPMQVRETELFGFLKNIFDSFVDHAAMRHIDYEFIGEELKEAVWLDHEKMSKVLFNLLSNAFKFTPDGGEIKMVVKQFAKEICIEVTDKGPGIDPAFHDQVFQRFYEKTPSERPSQIKGTGIGLSLSRQLVMLHHGRLELESQLERGSVFKVYLPLGKDHFDSKDFAKEVQMEVANLPSVTLPSMAEVSEEQAASNGQTGQPLLLIVEDNPEVQAYLIGIFAEEYKVSSAANGEEGLRKAVKEQPDLILSDVMMPKMNGFELCEKLKTELSTSHIPIILLTARTTLDDRIEGLETGADDYISKPFHPNELRLKVRNRLTQRQRLRAQFEKSPTFSPKEITVTSADEEFLNRLIELVEANINNPQFKIEQFAQELAVSRALLFTKIKALTNFTPKNFLKSFRLKRAAQLLESGKLNVSEVAYQVGFKEPKYFSKVFHKEYGCSPSEYSARHRSEV